MAISTKPTPPGFEDLPIMVAVTTVTGKGSAHKVLVVLQDLGFVKEVKEGKRVVTT